MNGLRAIVFDLDDTLYPERDFVLSGFHTVALWCERQFGISADVGYRDLKTLHDQGRRGDIFDVWLATHHAADAAIVAQMIEVYRTHQPALSPFGGAKSTLLMLKSRYRLGLVSDGYHEVQHRKLLALGLEPLFDAVVFSDLLGREYWKPHRRPFDEVLSRLNSHAEQSVYVADNPRKDFIGARNAGMWTIWAKWSQGDYTQIIPESALHGADFSFETFQELREFLLC